MSSETSGVTYWALLAHKGHIEGEVMPMTRTGPSSPEGNRGESAVKGSYVAKAMGCAPGCLSPIRRLGQRLVIRISSWLVPGCRNCVISALKGGFHKIATAWALTKSSAMFLTWPRSSCTRDDLRNHVPGIEILLSYVAVPEKYLTPGSELSVQERSSSNDVWEGAPRLGGKRTSHGPSSLVSTSE